jgi:hypothetical protein
LVVSIRSVCDTLPEGRTIKFQLVSDSFTIFYLNI